MLDYKVAKIGLLGSLLAAHGALSAPPHVPRQANNSLDEWLDTQEPIALEGVLANIGGQGSKVEGAADGLVVASPSKSDPDYFYTWTRDAALTMKALVDRFLVTESDDLETIIKSYVASQAKIQEVENPSGGIDSGGLGEPKFHVDGSAFTEDWGRPQRDGPALRATALIAYAHYLIDNGDTATVKDSIWPLVKRDVGYVTDTWNQTGFDLWEEVNGTSFFTLVAQHRSLIEGSAMASTVEDECPGCDTEAPKIRCLLKDMWNSGEGYMMADINNDQGRSNKGTNTFLASIHSYDQNAGCDNVLFQPCSPWALSNHKVVADSFKEWQINSDVPEGDALALGRYIEDVFVDGNPWYLTTSAAAEQLYYALAQWDKAESLEVTDVSLAFFKDVSQSEVATGQYEKGSNEYKTLTAAVRRRADGYLSIVQRHTPENGAMSEQFSKTDGTPLAAPDLTWSYAALLTAKAARDGNLPPVWGADGATGSEC